MSEARHALHVLILLTLGACGSSETPSPLISTSLSSSGIPSGAPPAAFDAVPEIPEPASWPFPQGAPRTSGTGRYAYGAYYWTDFLYDANGANGIGPPLNHIATPTGGSLVYPDESRMAGNGADIFRVGIGADADATYWRVDWLTLVDPTVPLAAFALDYTAGGTGTLDAWPGVPRLRAEGVDAVLLISSAGVKLLATGGAVLYDGPASLDLASRSFVARLPRSVLDPQTDQGWTLRLAATLHDGHGGVLDDMPSFNGLPTEPPVFNLAFRDYLQESPLNNFWFDVAQARSLAVGDATPYAVTLDWNRLNRERAEPEPFVSGYSNRWFVSSLDSGTEYGRTGRDASFNGSIGHPAFLDPVQPYGIYVPASYDAANPQPTPLTLMLHSFTQNHNQYGATGPNFQRDACERRNSICLTTLGRGPAGDYEGDAELDLWDAWQDVAAHFVLDPERTISSGYSMGANASIRLLIKYPDVFAAGVVLAGSQSEEPGRTQLENIQWNGYYHAHGSFDELIPFPDARATIDAIKALGYAYTFDHFLAEDHVVWPLKDELYSGYAGAAQWMLDAAPATRKRHPGDIHFGWQPGDIKPQYGVGPVGPWWLGELQAAADTALARIHARSEGRPEVAVTQLDFVQAPGLDLTTPSPRLREQQSQVLGMAPEAGGTVRLELTDVAQVSVDLVEAGVAERDDKRIVVSSNGPVTLILTGLPASTRVRTDTGTVESAAGRASILLPAGEDLLVSFE